MERFRFAASLDSSMGHHAIRLDPTAQESCAIVTPWGKHGRARLPMGAAASSDALQLKTMQLARGLEELVRARLDDVLAMGQGQFDDRLAQLEIAFDRLKKDGLKASTKKCNFLPPSSNA